MSLSSWINGISWLEISTVLRTNIGPNKEVLWWILTKHYFFNKKNKNLKSSHYRKVSTDPLRKVSTDPLRTGRGSCIGIHEKHFGNHCSYVNMPGDQNWVTKFDDGFPHQITTKPVKIFCKTWKCSHTIMWTMLYCICTWLKIGTVR